MTFNKIEETFFYTISAGAALIGCLLLFMILAEIIIRAIPSLTWYFITTPESMTPHIGMGIANAIWGSLIISLFATVIAIPLALGTAIYLQKYAAEGRITRAFRFFIEVLSGTPAIVVGIFGLLVLVTYLRPVTGGFSLLAGSIALAILIVPVIERSIENAISAVPFELEEGSYALGATKWQTIRMITLPTAVSGIITGAILGFGRAAEESAVVILTAGYSQFMPEFTIKPNTNLLFGIKIYPIQDLIGTLPYSVYHAYENSHVIKESNGFAAAVILISIVILVNFSAKIFITRAMPGRGFEGGSKSGILTNIAEIIGSIWKWVFSRQPTMMKSTKEQIPFQDQSKKPPLVPEFLSHHLSNVLSATKHKLLTTPLTRKKATGTVPPQENAENPTNPATNLPRPLLPFTIPAALLLLIAFLATIPPLHHILGPASPLLAGLFGAGLSLLLLIAGLIFGLLLAKRAGAFKGKTRRSGYAGVAAGICLLCVAGFVCASAAPGLFSTGNDETPSVSDNADRQARLAELMAQMEGEDDGVPAQDAGDPSALLSATPPPTVGAGNVSKGVTIPLKDALSLGESYRYGDATRICDATVYDYKILPFYFWWFIDYNRFVQKIPRTGNSYLVVFIRIEDIGTKSAIVPSAEKIRITNNGKIYINDPYFNKSVLSTYQTEYYSSNYDKLPYQWIRELGQDKRDYAFLTGYNIFGDEWVTMNATTTVTPTSTVTTTTTATEGSSETGTNTTSKTNGKGFFVKPGPGNAIDGYLIFEVPDNIVNEDLDKTYVEISFNANSGTRWLLKPAAG
ncbi:MAG: phosphate ABC transporter permease PstA [Methanoregula sp.]|nr:phosphate ABC transporter permease PstA [Methanoregula sp.]